MYSFWGFFNSLYVYSMCPLNYIIFVLQKKNNWRAKHEDFISNIKNARAVTTAIKTGAPLPPPPAQKRTVNPGIVVIM